MKNTLNTLKIGGVALALALIVAQENQTLAQGGQQGPPTFAQLLSEMDKNKDGKLSNSEVNGPLKNDFSKVDLNGDGYISKTEFEKAPKPEGGNGPRGSEKKKDRK